jgi:hypothetical protein
MDEDLFSKCISITENEIYLALYIIVFINKSFVLCSTAEVTSSSFEKFRETRDRQI